MTYLLPPNGRLNTSILPTDRICMPLQRRPIQTSKSPRLTVHRGSTVILRYQENGHVTLLSNTPTKPTSGQVYVYGTDQTRPDDTLWGIHRIWNAAGTGGDQRGKLLTNASFDDGKCYGPNFESPMYQQRKKQFRPDPEQGPNRWCQTLVQLPRNVRPGLYTLYWIWDWPSMLSDSKRGFAKKEEFYTTCMDLRVVSY